MKIKKEHVIVIVLTGILVSIAAAMAFYAFSPAHTEEDLTQSPTSAPQPARPTVQNAPETKTHPPVEYEQTAAQKMLDKLSANTPLSAGDVSAKEKVLSFRPPGQASGVVYRSPTVIIDYTNAADQFQVEILTADIAQAKADATSWLKSQGLSQQGICDLPVVFYLSHDVLNQLRDKNYTFNPLAEGC